MWEISWANLTMLMSCIPQDDDDDKDKPKADKDKPMWEQMADQEKANRDKPIEKIAVTEDNLAEIDKLLGIA